MLNLIYYVLFFCFGCLVTVVFNSKLYLKYWDVLKKYRKLLIDNKM